MRGILNFLSNLSWSDLTDGVRAFGKDLRYIWYVSEAECYYKDVIYKHRNLENK